MEDSEISDNENITPSNSPEKLNNALEQRQENIRKRDAFFASLLKDPEFAEAVEAINFACKDKQPVTRKSSPRKSWKKRTQFKYEPSEIRKSSRLRSLPCEYSEYDLVDITETERNIWRKSRQYYQYDSDYDDIEKVVYKPKFKRKSSGKTANRVFISVEDVTDEMLSRVVDRVSDKQYSDYGTSCHQCRQKTNDQKTCCRSEECIGVRGQFCGVCLKNRYGEDAVKALKDPNWYCPVCRGICNCSFCRAKAGKRPTGILAPLAKNYGHKSVKDFLDSLRGEGDYVDETKDPKKLLGFSKDFAYAQMGGSVKYQLEDHADESKLLMYIEYLEKSLQSFKPYQDNLLFGFENNVSCDEMNNGCKCCSYLQKMDYLKYDIFF